MKKVFISIFLLFSFYFSYVNAYEVWDMILEARFEAKKADYVKLLDEKILDKLKSFSKLNLIKLDTLVDEKIEEFKSTHEISEGDNIDTLALYYALKEIIDSLINPLVITIIDDNRCNNCSTDNLIYQLKNTPAISNAEIVVKDFSDNWIKDYLLENDIKKLPAIIFPTNDIWDPNLESYMMILNSWEYSLNIWANFDPFTERSDKWFLILDEKKYDEIKKDSYIKWNKEAKITWLEYSDLECPYCAKLHNSDVEENIKENYWDKVNKIFQHYPLDFHPNAMDLAIASECVWKAIEDEFWMEDAIKWYYDYIDVLFNLEDINSSTLIEKAVVVWASFSDFDTCLTYKETEDKIRTKMELWTKVFWISWTPANVLINNETLEYVIISWAYPYSSFEGQINELLK